MATSRFRLSFAATLSHVETDEDVQDPKLLAQLDGVREPADLATHANEGELPIGLLTASPVLRFDGSLSMTVDMELDREPSPEDVEALADFINRQIEGGWGMNYEFDLPSGLEDYMVHFDATPREQVPTARSDRLHEIEREFGPWDYERLTAQSTDELRAFKAKLEPYASEQPPLYQSIVAVLQQRAVSDSGYPKVSVDNLNALDDLPEDVF